MKLRSDAQSAEWSAEDDSALLFETHFLQKGALRIIVTDVFRCKSARTARDGARKMSVYNNLSLSCLVFRLGNVNKLNLKLRLEARGFLCTLSVRDCITTNESE